MSLLLDLGLSLLLDLGLCFVCFHLLTDNLRQPVKECQQARLQSYLLGWPLSLAASALAATSFACSSTRALPLSSGRGAT